jgi:hypothetical protein
MPWMCRKWKEERDKKPSIPPFEEWVQGAAEPAQRAMRYTKMKAFGNHFRVDDAASAELQTYDSGIAFVFEVPTQI